jgi:hypothetical protein
MYEESVEKLWLSLINDGFAGVFDQAFRSAGFSGVLSGIGGAGDSVAGSIIRGSVADSTVRESVRQRILPRFLPSIPLAGGLLRSLLGGDSAEYPVEPVRYAAPDPIRVTATLPTNRGTDVAGVRVPGEGVAEYSQAPSVVINVSAMDSLSILDRSDDIANAVRQAMLTYQPFDDIWR